LAKFPPKECWI